MNENLSAFISDGTPLDVIRRYESLVEHAASSDFGEFDRNIVVIDTETTGFSFHHDELIQIAAARIECGDIVDWYTTFVNPGKPIPDEIVHLTHISEENVADAPHPAEALSSLVDFVGDAKLVAHNAAFDCTFTTKHPAGYPLLENLWLDSLDMSRIALPRMKSHRLVDLVRAFGAPVSTHRADDDVAATCALYRILLAAIDKMPTPLIDQISRLASQDVWPTGAVFSYFSERHNHGEPDGAVGSTDSPERAEIEGHRTGRHQANGEQNGPSEAEDRRHSHDEADEGNDPILKHAFSLRTLRRNRLKTLDLRPKQDAAAISEQSAASIVFPTMGEIDRAFDYDGVVGSLYSDFEPRQEQKAMAEAVSKAFSTSNNLVVEAGTGVGKSMAYLLPAALTALKNNITIGIATKTNALLDQLVYHELPALSEALGSSNHDPRGASFDASGSETSSTRSNLPTLTFMPLKGYTHYPCLLRINRLVREGVGLRKVGNEAIPQAPSLAALLSFIEQTEYDDIDGLKIDYRALPRRFITTTSHECLRRKCPFFGAPCFVHGSRKRAEAAHIVVTNHSLLFCDLAADGGLLPPIRFWIVDEAHNAENEARRAFSLSLATDDINRLVSRVSSEDSSRNVFVRAERTVVVEGAEESTTLFYALTSKAKSAGMAFAESAAAFTAEMRELLFFDDSRHSKNYESVEIWINGEIRSSEHFQNLVQRGRIMIERAEKLITASQEIVGYLEDVENAALVQREIAAAVVDLKSMVTAADEILFKGTDQYVYSTTLSRKGDRPIDALNAMLFNVGMTLNETLYAQTHSVVFTSATLTVGDSFQAFESSVGLNQGEYSQCDELLLHSSYDYDSQMTIYVVEDMPEPNQASYLDKLVDLLIGVHKAQQGSFLTLFTNRREMERSFEAVQPVLKEDHLRLVCQKWGLSIKGLRDEFLADEHLSLFALKSFWEGFDAPGATLKGVIIPKLPFAKPTDPLSCERSSRDDQAWRRYVLPAAVMETKQAAGRLIRKADDTGVLILADKRLLTKGYGKVFLRSLPSRNIKVLPMRQIAAELQERIEDLRES